MIHGLVAWGIVSVARGCNCSISLPGDHQGGRTIVCHYHAHYLYDPSDKGKPYD